jgi:hypothetical protein
MSQPENETPEIAPAYAAPQRQDQTPVEEPARLGPMARLTGTLLSPGETFADINRKPTWIAPVIIAMLTVVVSTLFFQWRVNPDWDSIMRNQIRKRMERSNQSLTEEQMQQQVTFAKSIAKFSPIIAAVFTPIVYAIVAGIFALGMMLIQGKTTYKKILSVVAWSWAATGVVATIVTIASLMVRDQESLRSIDPTQSSGIVPSNVAAFLPSDTAAVIKSLAGSIDIFSIWLVILMSIGFAAIAGSRKITARKTGTLVVGAWVLLILIKVGWVAAFGG